MAPLRFALFLFALVGFAGFDVPAQRILRRLGRTRAAFALQGALCRVLCALLRIEIVVQGAPPPPGPAFVVANHVSWTDILVLGSIAPLRFLAKSEVARWPVIGAVARAHGALFVQRRARRGAAAANGAIASALADGPPVVLFAEATTGNGSRLEPFRAGHLGAARDLLAERPMIEEIPLVPAAITYTRQGGLPCGRRERAGLAWFGDMTLFPHLLALLRAGPVRCELVWGEPVPFRRGDDRKERMRLVRARVKRAFDPLVSGRDAPVNPPSHAI